MKSSLLQLKLKLGNMQSPNQVTCQHFCSTLKTAQPLVGVQQMLHHEAKENKIVSFLFGPMCFRCLVWPTAAINHQWAEQERVLIDLVFQALLVFQELLVSQVMLKYTHSFSFINLDGAGVSVILVVPCIWLQRHCCVGSSGVGGVPSEFCSFLCLLLFYVCPYLCSTSSFLCLNPHVTRK